MAIGTDIIIKGGSVKIRFPESIFHGSNGQYSNDQKQIESVEVTDDNTGQVQTIKVPANGKCTIRVNTR